jgi:hypothetical protein
MGKLTALDKIAVEARRTRVSEGITARKSYRVMADEEGVALGTIAADVKWLRTQWAKERGDNSTVLEQALRDMDAWQGQRMEDLPNLPIEKRPGAIDTLIRLNDQRLKSLGLYPRTSATTGLAGAEAHRLEQARPRGAARRRVARHDGRWQGLCRWAHGHS